MLRSTILPNGCTLCPLIFCDVQKMQSRSFFVNLMRLVTKSKRFPDHNEVEVWHNYEYLKHSGLIVKYFS
ncbi:uncharacterized protein LOC105663633 isoform X1 [Megachile rotundata]|uniref:uncharacterized protein LOC105663633 isoform X1 n=1 Tax=Megachile rotundata TaxID=143995 RepID=UPI003FD06C53